MSTAVALMQSSMPSKSTPVQSGPYTKAQFQHTIEGSRNIRSVKEIEQLLHDYPAALELYRSGKYKVKVKCEVDVERVILVEKRIAKSKSNHSTSTDAHETNPTLPDLESHPAEETRKERAARRSRSRTQSQDRLAAKPSASISDSIVHTASSSIRVTSNAQPKVDHHRALSKERAVSINSHRRSDSVDSEHAVAVAHDKQQDKPTVRDYPQAPASGAPQATLWPHQRFVRPYFSNPLFPVQQRSTFYVPSLAAQRPFAPQTYGQGPRPTGPLLFAQPAAYPKSSTGAMANRSFHSPQNYSVSSRFALNTSQNRGLPPALRTFHPHHSAVPVPNPIYKSQVSLTSHQPWPTMSNGLSGTVMNPNTGFFVGPRQNPKCRAHSIGPGQRSHAPVLLSCFPQPGPAFDPHRQHMQPNHVLPATKTEPSNITGKETSVPSKGSVQTEKLTIRQLDDAFIQADASGRLPFGQLPEILQRFGIVLTEHDLISAARDLDYNVNDPVSARRLVHILVKLGKIIKSKHTAASSALHHEDKTTVDERQTSSNPWPY